MIIAEFEVEPDRLEQFLELAKTDARQSVAVEPGCRQFDVALHREQPNRVMLYEGDDDRAACQAHFPSRTGTAAASSDGRIRQSMRRLHSGDPAPSLGEDLPIREALAG